MSRSGILRKVFDNETKNGKSYWTLIVEEEGKDVKLNLWDHVFAGREGKKGEPPICDVHDFEGEIVIFDADPGAVKDNETGERWPDTVKMIGPFEGAIGPSEPKLLKKDEAASPKIDAAIAAMKHIQAAKVHIAAAEEELKQVT